MNKGEDRGTFIIENSCKWIDQLELDRVFDRFYMADRARTNVSTGLGLFIAKEFVLEMNGTIRTDIRDDHFIVEIGFLIEK